MATSKPSVAMRFDKLDKAALVELASRLQMSQTQTVRVLVRETLAILKEREDAHNADHQTRMAAHAKPSTN